MASATIPTKRTNEIVIRTKSISQQRDVPRLVRPRRVWLRRRDGDALSRRWRGVLVVDVLIEGSCITRVRFYTPCTESADDRARRMMTRRTPCIVSADGRADKHGTPCSSSASSPRARTARSASGLSSASSPSSSDPHRSPPPPPRLLSHPRLHPEPAPSPWAATPSSSGREPRVTKSRRDSSRTVY